MLKKDTVTRIVIVARFTSAKSGFAILFLVQP